MLLPHRVFLLRGNHETKFCTSTYGFEQEVIAKYKEYGKHMYRKLLGCFEGHPLAARVANCVFMAHGGLFRQIEVESSQKKGKFGKGYRSSFFMFLPQGGPTGEGYTCKSFATLISHKSCKKALIFVCFPSYMLFLCSHNFSVWFSSSSWLRFPWLSICSCVILDYFIKFPYKLVVW